MAIASHRKEGKEGKRVCTCKPFQELTTRNTDSRRTCWFSVVWTTLITLQTLAYDGNILGAEEPAKRAKHKIRDLPNRLGWKLVLGSNYWNTPVTSTASPSPSSLPEVQEPPVIQESTPDGLIWTTTALGTSVWNGESNKSLLVQTTMENKPKSKKPPNLFKLTRRKRLRGSLKLNRTDATGKDDDLQDRVMETTASEANEKPQAAETTNYIFSTYAEPSDHVPYVQNDYYYNNAYDYSPEDYGDYSYKSPEHDSSYEDSRRHQERTPKSSPTPSTDTRHKVKKEPVIFKYTTPKRNTIFNGTESRASRRLKVSAVTGDFRSKSVFVAGRADDVPLERAPPFEKFAARSKTAASEEGTLAKQVAPKVILRDTTVNGKMITTEVPLENEYDGGPPLSLLKGLDYHLSFRDTSNRLKMYNTKGVGTRSVFVGGKAWSISDKNEGNSQ